MRMPKLFDRGSWKRTGIAVAVVLALFGLFYLWQPQRIDLFEHRPEKPLARIPLKEIDLFEPGRRVAVVTGHPDDEAFYVGGTLFRLQESGAAVSLIVLTDGDKGYYPFFDSETLSKQRQAETREAARQVGIREVVFFSYPDGRLSHSKEVVARLTQELRRLDPEVVLGFDPYYWPRISHRDHRISGEITRDAMKASSFSGWALYFSTVAPTTAIDVDKTWSRAQELLGVHASQFNGEKLGFIQGFVSQNALETGETFGYGFAEGFRAVKFQGGKPIR